MAQPNETDEPEPKRF